MNRSWPGGDEVRKISGVVTASVGLIDLHIQGMQLLKAQLLHSEIHRHVQRPFFLQALLASN